MYASDRSTTTASSLAIAPDGGITCELLEGGVHAEFGLLHIGDQLLVTVKEVLHFCVAVLNAIAIDQCSCGQVNQVRWRGTTGRRSPRTRGSNTHAPFQRTPPPLWLLQVGPGWSMWGSSMGPFAGSLQWNGFQSSGSGTTGRTQCTRRQPNQRGHDCHKLSMGLGRGLGAAQSPPG